MENKDITKEEAEKWANERLEQIRKDNPGLEERIFKDTIIGLPFKYKFRRIGDEGDQRCKIERLPDYDITTDINQEEDSNHPSDLF